MSKPLESLVKKLAEVIVRSCSNILSMLSWVDNAKCFVELTKILT